MTADHNQAPAEAHGGAVLVPLAVLEDASRALGAFVSDEGWGDADMQAMDNLDAYIARHKANAAAYKGQPKAHGDERAAFEAEMRCEEEWGLKNLKRDKHGHYLNSWTGTMWAVWQARAALEPKAQPKGTLEAVEPESGDWLSEAIGNLADAVSDAVTATVKAHGQDGRVHMDEVAAHGALSEALQRFERETRATLAGQSQSPFGWANALAVNAVLQGHDGAIYINCKQEHPDEIPLYATQAPAPAQRAEWVGISLSDRLDNLMHAAKWDADEVPHLKANLIRDIERCAPSPAVVAEPPTDARIAHAKTIPSDRQTPLDAACEILGHLRSIGATYYYTHRMQQVIQALPAPACSQPPVQHQEGL